MTVGGIRAVIPAVIPADLDNASPENSRHLQEVAKKFIASEFGKLDDICAQLEEGRGSDMPGIGIPFASGKLAKPLYQSKLRLS